jgi:hypothetical protein
MAPADFEFLINLICTKIMTDSTHRADIPVGERLAVTHTAVLATGDSYTACNTFSKIGNKQSARLFQKPISLR